MGRGRGRGAWEKVAVRRESGGGAQEGCSKGRRVAKIIQGSGGAREKVAVGREGVLERGKGVATGRGSGAGAQEIGDGTQRGREVAIERRGRDGAQRGQGGTWRRRSAERGQGGTWSRRSTRKTGTEPAKVKQALRRAREARGMSVSLRGASRRGGV